MKRREILQILIEKYGAYCFYCGWGLEVFFNSEIQIDHVFPRSKGGKDEILNYRLACRNCNYDKKNRTINEWIKDLKERVAIRNLNNMIDENKLKNLEKL